MLRNLGLVIFALSCILFGLFDFIPNHMFIFIIFATMFDAFALYFSFINKKIYNRNPDLKKLIDTYLKYTKPQGGTILFFIDRFIFATILICLAFYYNYTYGFCK